MEFTEAESNLQDLVSEYTYVSPLALPLPSTLCARG